MSDHVNDCDCCQRKLTALRIAGTIDGIHLRQRDAYRDALTDLIEDLRGRHADCTTCYTKRALDRAEARLRAITHGDTPTTQANPNHDTPPTITP